MHGNGGICTFGGAEAVLGLVEVQHIAGVVAVAQQHAGAVVGGFGHVVDLLGGGGREQVAHRGTMRQALAHQAAEFYFLGKVVLLDHGHGVQSLYAHLSRLEVAEGMARTVAGGIPGSKGALVLRSLQTGTAKRPTNKQQQDDFIASVIDPAITFGAPRGLTLDCVSLMENSGARRDASASLAHQAHKE